jgi:DNA processing protein
MLSREELHAWLTLLRTPQFAAARLRELLVETRQAPAALERLQRRRSTLPEAARAWLEHPDEARLSADLDWLEEPNHRLLCCTDEDFPPQLEAIPQPPAALFVVGDSGLLLRAQVAIVGSRSAGPVGLATAREFAAELTRRGLLVTSGMADGIDGAAHEAALDAGGATVAVIGTGPDRVYPQKHHELARRIAAAGAIVSEFPPGTSARPSHFPSRNRIIAGLALGTLVVEAGLRSGSLITARLAGEQGREVFALPGSIHNPLAAGCHELIGDGARLVQRPQDIVDALAPAARELGNELAARLAAEPSAKPMSSRAAAEAAGPAWRSDPEYRRLLDAMGYDPAALDDLVVRCGLKAAALSSMLLMLELEGVVAGLPGNRYQRLPEP